MPGLKDREVGDYMAEFFLHRAGINAGAGASPIDETIAGPSAPAIQDAIEAPIDMSKSISARERNTIALLFDVTDGTHDTPFDVYLYTKLGASQLPALKTNYYLVDVITGVVPTAMVFFEHVYAGTCVPLVKGAVNAEYSMYVSHFDIQAI